MEEWGFFPGDEVELRGLSKLELNGQRGTILPLENPEQARLLGRLAVMTRAGKQLSLKVENLIKVVPPDQRAGGDRGEEWSQRLKEQGMAVRLPLLQDPSRPEPKASSRGLLLMAMNLRRLMGSQDTAAEAEEAARKQLAAALTENLPDLICVQEGLEGSSVVAEVGYVKLISSAVRARPLHEMLYGDESALEMAGRWAMEQLVVNELYLRAHGGTGSWEAVETGVEQMSSDVLLRPGDEAATPAPLAPRSAVWARLRPKGSTEGPFIFVLTAQVSGGEFEEECHEQLEGERRLQVRRALDLFSSRSCQGDLGVLVADFGEAARHLLTLPQVAGNGPVVQDLFELFVAEPFEALTAKGWATAALPGRFTLATSRELTPKGPKPELKHLEVPEALEESMLKVLLGVGNRLLTGLETLPAVGFGTCFMPEDMHERVPDQDFRQKVEELTEAAVFAALRAGVRLFDCSNRHQNQPAVGKALEKAMTEGLVQREELFICGRLSRCKDRPETRLELDCCLRELRLQQLDLVTMEVPPERAPAAWTWLEEIHREGKARFLGVTNFDLLGPKVCVELFRDFVSRVRLLPAVFVMEVHPYNTNEEMSDCCQALNIQVLAYSPLGAPHKLETFMKVLTKSDAAELRPLLKVPESPTLQEIGKRHGVSAAQVALRWNLQRGHCVVPKSFQPEHIAENAKLFDFALSREEMAIISKLHKGVRAERFFQVAFSSSSKAIPRMTRDAYDECHAILAKLRGPAATAKPTPSAGGSTSSTAPATGSASSESKTSESPAALDPRFAETQKPVEELPGFWRRMGKGKGPLAGKGGAIGGAGAYLPMREGLPVGGKGATGSQPGAGKSNNPSVLMASAFPGLPPMPSFR